MRSRRSPALRCAQGRRSSIQIFRRVYFREAFPGILSGIILTMISLVGYSAVGAGGPGGVAILKGSQAYKIEYLIATSVVLIAFVRVVQSAGNRSYNQLS